MFHLIYRLVSNVSKESDGRVNTVTVLYTTSLHHRNLKIVMGKPKAKRRGYFREDTCLHKFDIYLTCNIIP